MTDAGMCGDYDSIIGMDKDEPLRRATLKIPSSHLEPAKGPGTVSGVAIETDDATGLAKSISAVRIGPGLTPAEPDF
jgi:calcineurin-like phosphoesterase